MTVINPPGDDWHDRIFRRFREARDRARRGDCRDCRGEGLGMRHYAYPSECPGRPPLGGYREPHKDDL